jgi:hypothetical protein
MITIEESFDVIQKVLAAGFETKTGSHTPWILRLIRMLADS